MEDAAPGVPKALTRPSGALLELLNPPEDVPMEVGCSPLGGGPPGCPGRRQVAEAPGADGEGQGAGGGG